MRNIILFIENINIKAIDKVVNFLIQSTIYNTVKYKYGIDIDRLNIQKYEMCIFIGFDCGNEIHSYTYSKLLEHNPLLKFIEIQSKSTKCHFNKSCDVCVNRNYISIKDYNLGRILNLIDNFDDNICQVLSKKGITSHIEHIKFFRDLDAKTLKMLQQNIILKNYAQNSVVFYQGEPIKYFYFLVSGFLKQYVGLENGTTSVIRQFSKPSFICEDESYKNNRFLSNVETLSDSDILMIEKNYFIDLLNRDFRLMKLMLDLVLDKMIESKKLFINNHSSKTEYQLALKLYEKPYLFKYTKKFHLADELNITPETLSRAIKKFKKLNILNVNNDVICMDKLKSIIQNT